jgi:S1-C subfamily serine protease
VIYGLNGAAVTTLDEFKRAVARIPSGAPCVLQVQRSRRLMFVAVEID